MELVDDAFALVVLRFLCIFECLVELFLCVSGLLQVEAENGTRIPARHRFVEYRVDEFHCFFQSRNSFVYFSGGFVEPFECVMDLNKCHSTGL